MAYVIIDVFLLFFLILGIFQIPGWAVRGAVLAALILIWVIFPHIAYFFARKKAFSKIKSTADKSGAVFTDNGKNNFTLVIDGKKTLNINVLPTRYRIQTLHFENNGKYWREYFFSIFGKVKLNLPFAVKSKQKAMPDKAEDAENCILLIRQPMGTVFTATNAPNPVYPGDNVMGHKVYELQSFLNIMTGEHKY